MSEERFNPDGMSDEEIAAHNKRWDEAEAREGKWPNYSTYLQDMQVMGRFGQLPAYASMVNPNAQLLTFDGDYPINSSGGKAKHHGDKLQDERLCVWICGYWWVWRWNQ